MINCKAQAEIRFTKRGVGGKGSWKSAVFWFIGEGPIFPWFGWQCLCCFFLKDCQPTDLIYLPIYIYCIYIYQKKGISTIYIYICIETVEVKDVSKAIEIAFPSIC